MFVIKQLEAHSDTIVAGEGRQVSSLEKPALMIGERSSERANRPITIIRAMERVPTPELERFYNICFTTFSTSSE
jgi:hypothetical protein